MTTSLIAIPMNGGRRSISMDLALRGSASFSSRTPVTGSKNFIWTDLRLDAVHAFHDARSRPCGRGTVSSGQDRRQESARLFWWPNVKRSGSAPFNRRAGRVGIGWSMERRFSPCGTRGGHRAKRRLLHRLSGNAARTHFMRETGVSLPRSTISMAGRNHEGPSSRESLAEGFVFFTSKS